MHAPPRILFVCTGNSCRSQMAEALLRHLGQGRFRAFSAGSHPAGYVHPLAVAALGALNIPQEGLRSKSWNAFLRVSVDVVITVCDHAANEVCPVIPGSPIRSHWPLPDPATMDGPHETRIKLAVEVARTLRARILRMIQLPFETLSPAELKVELDGLANMKV